MGLSLQNIGVLMKKQNKLLLKYAYLCGPIDRCPDDGRGWRDDITPKLKKMGVVVLNPLDKPSVGVALEDKENREARKKAKGEEGFDEVASLMKEIRNIDLRMVDLSSFLIVYLDLNVYPTGIMEELFLANHQKKPVLIMCKQGKSKVPDWLFGAIPHETFFSSWESLLNYLRGVDKGEVIDHTDRWRFFDLKDLVKEAIGK